MIKQRQLREHLASSGAGQASIGAGALFRSSGVFGPPSLGGDAIEELIDSTSLKTDQRIMQTERVHQSVEFLM